MIMLIKKHEQLIDKARLDSYNAGYIQGQEYATQKLENGFKRTLTRYNDISIGVRKENAKLTLKVRKLENELNAKTRDIKSKDKAIKIVGEFTKDSREVVEEKERKIDILKFFLRCNYSKDVARYEAIAKRTKKDRIREKAEKKIIELKALELAFE